jgi:predicted phage terminase large subunit-like protein
MEAARNIDVPDFGSVMFRRTYPQITAEGGLWDSSYDIYKPMGAKEKDSTLEWIFPSGNRVKFAHMQHEQDRYQWDGAQIPLIQFDQLEHFTWKQFFYMLSRNRTTCGVMPYVRASCNPDPDHWLRDFMRWWINDDTGFPVYERGGVLRWFVVLNEEVHWADTPGELKERLGDDVLPKSFTFQPGKVNDNAILMRDNPEYMANLEALPYVDRMRLLEGNWNVRETAGTIFRREWFEIVDAAPAALREVRYWDRAATPAEQAKKQKASHTAGLKMRQAVNDVYYVMDVSRFQESPGGVRENIKNVATQDGVPVPVVLEQDPGQAGVAEVQSLIRYLAGFNARANAVRESKGVRAKPLSAQAEAGNVKLVRGAWVEQFLREADNFDGTDACVSDQIDAGSGAFYILTNEKRAGVWSAEG